MIFCLELEVAVWFSMERESGYGFGNDRFLECFAKWKSLVIIYLICLVQIFLLGFDFF